MIDSRPAPPESTVRCLTLHTIMRSHRSLDTKPISSMVLVFAAVLTILMPVNYRAGADHVHAHTVFQTWIDAATGRSHHHHEYDHHDAATLAIQPDTAEPLTSHMPIQHANLLGALSALIALMSVGVPFRLVWPRGDRLAGIIRRLDPPPPRASPA